MLDKQTYLDARRFLESIYAADQRQQNKEGKGFEWLDGAQLNACRKVVNEGYDACIAEETTKLAENVAFYVLQNYAGLYWANKHMGWVTRIESAKWHTETEKAETRFIPDHVRWVRVTNTSPAAENYAAARDKVAELGGPEKALAHKIGDMVATQVMSEDKLNSLANMQAVRKPLSQKDKVLIDQLVPDVLKSLELAKTQLDTIGKAVKALHQRM